MPVIATPALAPRLPSCALPETPVSPSPVSCTTEFTLTARTAKSRNQPVLTRTKAVRVFSGTDADVEYQMIDEQGNPLDLRDCLCAEQLSSSEGSLPSSTTACPYDLVFRMLEYFCSLGERQGQFLAGVEFPVALVDAATGLVRVRLPAEATRIPGVYFGQIALVQKPGPAGPNDEANEIPIFGNTFYLYVNRSAWSQTRAFTGPPTIAEVRLHLRDNDSNESFLLDDIMFDDAEVAQAAVLAVQQWNETRPIVRKFNTTNFPYRFHWLHAICASLFMTAAEQFRRNNLQYSAAGIEVNDQDKERNYEQAAAGRMKLWMTFMKQEKVSLNLDRGWGGIGSDYRFW